MDNVFELVVPVLLSVLVVLGSGCGVDNPSDAGGDTDTGSSSTETCEKAEDCPVGQACRSGRCYDVPLCQNDDDCQTGRTCIEGGCYAADAVDQTPDAGDTGQEETGTPDASDGDTTAETDADADDGGGTDTDAGEDDSADATEVPEFLLCRSREYRDGMMTVGAPYREETSTYRPDGQVRTETVKYREFPSINYKETHDYDDQGRLIQIEEDDEIDGSVDDREVFLYDDQGRLTEHKRDYGADGEIDSVDDHIYDGDQRIRTEVDTSGDGEPDRIERFSYDDNGYLSVKGIDYSADDTIDHRYLYDYDDQGRKKKYEKDLQNDRMIDYVQTWSYDGMRVVETSVDDDADGTVDEVTTHTYDGPEGRLSRIEERDGDGMLERDEKYEYTITADKRSVRIEIDTDGDGLVDRVTIEDHSAGCIVMP